MINKFSRHLGQKYRGDRRSRTRPHSLQTCSTSLRTVILSIPREDILGCQFPLTRNIGPGPSSHIVGTQGKIGPHSYNSVYKICVPFTFRKLVFLLFLFFLSFVDTEYVKKRHPTCSQLNHYFVLNTVSNISFINCYFYFLNSFVL